MKRVIFLGRFQPFHKGHLEAVKNILKEGCELVIIMGSSQYSHKLQNPFTTGERITMIRRCMEEEKISSSRYLIVPVPDVHTHMLWVSQIMGYSPKFETVYTNEPLSRRLFIEAGFKVKSIPFVKREVYSATEIRKRMIKAENWEELVPDSVASFIKEIEGVARIQDLIKTDLIT